MLLVEQVRRADDLVVVDRQDVDDRPAAESLDELVVGKRGYRDSCRQDDINEMMVKLVRSGKHVVRLKGGDPSIFGRYGEEIAHLETQGIPVEIIPGITAASAAAARLGVSLTHRDCAQSVRFTTGHGRAGGLTEDLDWAGIADPKATNIFYMAGRTGKRLAEQLSLHGMPPETPVTLVSAVTRPEETIRRMNLADLLREDNSAMSGPVLVCFGEVFSSANRKPVADIASYATIEAVATG